MMTLATSKTRQLLGRSIQTPFTLLHVLKVLLFRLARKEGSIVSSDLTSELERNFISVLEGKASMLIPLVGGVDALLIGLRIKEF